ncbi:hypothetical protein PG623_02415 [Riemerella anatipestifer]|nr:hypothetical protein [Riemerella anatipestifer]
MEFIDLIVKLTPIIGIILTFILGKPIDLFINMSLSKSKKLSNLKELGNIIENYDDEFVRNFVIPNAKENYFYLQTGIKTNEQTIPKYISLKNKIGEKYDWDSIRKMKKYLYIDSDNEFKIKISFSKRYGGILFMAFAVMFLLISAYFFYVIVADLTNNHYVNLGKFITTFLMALFFAFTIMYLNTPFIIARNLEKKVNNYC